MRLRTDSLQSGIRATFLHHRPAESRPAAIPATGVRHHAPPPCSTNTTQMDSTHCKYMHPRLLAISVQIKTHTCRCLPMPNYTTLHGHTCRCLPMPHYTTLHGHTCRCLPMPNYTTLHGHTRRCPCRPNVLQPCQVSGAPALHESKFLSSKLGAPRRGPLLLLALR